MEAFVVRKSRHESHGFAVRRRADEHDVEFELARRLAARFVEVHVLEIDFAVPAQNFLNAPEKVGGP